MIPFSVLDLAPILEGGDARDALRNSTELAERAEAFGYHRYWLAEHHNMPGIASAATSVMLAHVGRNTKTIRLGAGGIMLPNHAPLVIAEQFGTLDAIYPGRIDLGLGRAPGTDGRTAQALRRTLIGGEDRFPRDVMELADYLGPPHADQRVRAIPGQNSNIPLWILGSSTYGAQVAAALGLPFGFASHFAPRMMMQAIQIYRDNFRPSAQLERPYVMLGFNVYAARTDEEARFLASSIMQTFANMRRGTPTRMPPPRHDIDNWLQPGEAEMLRESMAASAIGGPETVKAELQRFIAQTGADELILAAHIYDHGARLRSYEIAAEVREALSAPS